MVAGSLGELLKAEVRARFADMQPEIHDPGEAWAAVVRIPSTSRPMGDVLIYADPPGTAGIVVEIEGMTHGHFDLGDKREMVESCCDFLADLFADKVVVWGSESAGEGGWFYRHHGVGGRSWMHPDAMRAIWSRPWMHPDAMRAIWSRPYRRRLRFHDWFHRRRPRLRR